MTIVQAIEQVMRAAGTPLSAREVYDAIMAASLYTFRAKAPQQIVAQQIRRHCKGIDTPNAAPVKLFQRVSANRFSLLVGSQRVA